MINNNFNPDPIWHRYISFAKSAIRIIAGTALCVAELNTAALVAGALLIIAEVLGIVEELV